MGPADGPPEASRPVPTRSWRTWTRTASTRRCWLATPTAAGAPPRRAGGRPRWGGARLGPERVAGLVLLASVGPGCLTGADWPLAAPASGEFFALMAWRLTPWLARAGLAAITRLRRRPLAADEFVNLQTWGYAHHDHGAVWRSFLAEQR